MSELTPLQGTEFFIFKQVLILAILFGSLYATILYIISRVPAAEQHV